MKTIVIIVSPDGNTRLETNGFSGAGCRDASLAIERALGDKADEQLTPEFYQSTSTEQRHVQQRD